MKQAMITIEVLISLLILFMIISTSATTVKQLNLIRTQQINQESLYIAVLNIKDLIDKDICIKKSFVEGLFDDFSYQAKCDKIKELRNFQQATDDDSRVGNIGQIMVRLYKISLTIRKDNLYKSFSYYKTVIKRAYSR